MATLRAFALLMILAVATYAAAGASLSDARQGVSFERLTLYRGR